MESTSDRDGVRAWAACTACTLKLDTVFPLPRIAEDVYIAVSLLVQPSAGSR
jgi:hypothetical protein